MRVYSIQTKNTFPNITVHQTHFIVVCLLCSWAMTGSMRALADGIEAPTNPQPRYFLEIDKSDRTLKVKYAGEVYRQFPVAWGRGGDGDKQRLGDKRTPEGIYRIVGFNESSRFHLFMRLNYPNVKDALSGLENDVISHREFENIINSLRRGKLPPQNTALGGAIGIHGVGVQSPQTLGIHSSLNWTEGCVALTNEEIRELRNYVAIGTEVVIKQ